MDGVGSRRRILMGADGFDAVTAGEGRGLFASRGDFLTSGWDAFSMMILSEGLGMVTGLAFGIACFFPSLMILKKDEEGSVTAILGLETCAAVTGILLSSVVVMVSSKGFDSLFGVEVKEG